VKYEDAEILADESIQCILLDPAFRSMEKIFIDRKETDRVSLPTGEQVRETVVLPSPIGKWTKVAMTPLVFVLPVLCLVTLVIRVAMRGLPPRTRFAWLSYLSSLLMVSGVLTSAAAAVALTWAPQKIPVARTLAELDSRTSFPTLPSALPLDGRGVWQILKPLVEVVSPPLHSWMGVSGPSSSFGAAVLLNAGPSGYLFATARHVIGEQMPKKVDRAFVSLESGPWAAADVVARHQSLDLALLWLPREPGTEPGKPFVLPVLPRSEVVAGEDIYVIGHPQGLRFSLSKGLVSRADRDTIQISAPVSPGNSGGPVFDEHGNLLGIVVSMVDRSSNPNAENLNFAVPADALLAMEGWRFAEKGQERLKTSLQLRAAAKHQ
jgi:S1-C subfamily serine protease